MKGDISVHAVVAGHLCEPYNKIASLLAEAETPPALGDFMAHIGPRYFGIAIQARDSVMQMAPSFDPKPWIEALEASWLTEALAREHETCARALRDGRPYDPTRLTQIQSANTTSYWRTLSQVQAITTPYYPCGVKAIDATIGGLPKSLVVLGGETGSGKTFMAQLIAAGIAAQGQQVYVFSREMTAEDIRFRMTAMGAPLATLDNIHVDDRPLDIDQMRAILLRDTPHGPPGLIVIDFIDYICAGGGEPEYAHAYAACADMYKDHRCTILALAQISREGTGVMPRKFHLRYSKLAESLAALVLLVLNPHAAYYDAGVLAHFPYQVRGRDVAYVVDDKSRYGATGQQALGVIEMSWGGAQGWVDDGLHQWHNMTAYSGLQASRGGNNNGHGGRSSSRPSIGGPSYSP